jgi:hypothetical protein
MISPDDYSAAEAMALQVRDGTKERGKPLLFLVYRPPRPRRRSCRNRTAGEERERGGILVLDVEPPRVPPFVGLHGGDGQVLLGPRPAKMDSSTSYRGRRSVSFLDQGDGEEVPLELEVRFDP